MNKPTVWILGDQLRLSISALAELAPGACRVLMIESVTRSHELPFHKKKIAFVWSAMRHFADELRHLGYDVDYHTASPSYASALALHIKHCRPNEVRIMETSEHGRAAILAKRVEAAGVQAILTPNNSFLSDEADFGRWARGKKRLLLETFYRSMRRKTGILMEGDEPVGGSWNYDRESCETEKNSGQSRRRDRLSHGAPVAWLSAGSGQIPPLHPSTPCISGTRYFDRSGKHPMGSGVYKPLVEVTKFTR